MQKRPYFESVYNLFKFCCTNNSEYCIKIWVDKKISQEYSSISFASI